jgi:23S rRNA (guanosine2251-2'-O)-methyltransferase
MSEYLTGKNAIIELLQKDPKRIVKVIVEKGYRSDRTGDILDLCRKNGVRFDIVPSVTVPGAEGRGIAALVSPYEYADLDELHLSSFRAVLILDGIEDPHNLGAIIRSAAASGCGLVIIPERNAAQVTETVINVSAGTVYKIAVAKVKNIAAAMDRLKENGFWITGTDMDGEREYTDYDYTVKSAIVIGNEGKGLRRLVREKCDDVVRIDLENGVESLNASVAAALILFEMKKRT